MDDEIALCQVSKQIMIHHLPPVLILHMKRFDIGFDEVTKDDRHVSFPEILDMAPYCTTKCLEVPTDCVVALMSIICLCSISYVSVMEHKIHYLHM